MIVASGGSSIVARCRPPRPRRLDETAIALAEPAINGGVRVPYLAAQRPASGSFTR